MKRKTKPEVSNEDNTDESSVDITKLLGELQPARKLLKNLLKDEEEAHSENVPQDKEETLTKEESEEDEEVEDDESDEENGLKDVIDPFSVHFEHTLSEEVMSKIKDIGKMEKTKSVIKNNLCKEEFLYNVEDANFPIHVHTDSESGIFQEACIKDKLVKNWALVNRKKKSKENLSKLQRELLKPFSTYKDLYYADRNFDNGEEIRRLYTLHAVNHVLKTRNKILKHNAKLQHAAENGVELEDLRDQGLTRPKVLILVPFKDSCFKVVNTMRKMLFGGEKKAQVMKKKRFNQEFSSEEADFKGFRPEDFKSMFEGNIDDCFKIGVSISKNTMKLFAPFYSADVIIASPLGLRTVIGGKGEKQDYDFLSSIEILIMDQTDVFLMQNWEHVITVLNHLNKTPKSTHETDISRVRMWSINEWSKYYRQTLLFSPFQCPEINSIFNRYCFNFAGKNKWMIANIPGSIRQIVSEVPQVFRRVDSEDYGSLPDKRFDHFVNQVLPDLRKIPSSIAIYVPSYFDFVRVRNYLKKEEINFVQISEYTQKSYSSSARTLFQAGSKQILVFTGRFFFYYRYRITGIKHLLFYDLPQYAHFYSEIINFMEPKVEGTVSSISCTALFSKYDAHKLEGVVGTERMKRMMTGKAIHMIVTGQ